METLKVWGAPRHGGWGGTGLQPLQAPQGCCKGSPSGQVFWGTALGPISGMREVLPGSQHDPWIDTQHDQLWGGWSWE